MSKYIPSQIRNVALVSHSGAGKTTLTEAMLYTAKVINRVGKVEAGSTVCDYDEEEVKKQITINTVPAPLEWENNKINLLDTPGYFDFVGEVFSALSAVDSALIVVCAVNGVEVGTEQMWEHTDNFNLPRMIYINKLERENANFYKVLDQLKNKFGNKVMPLIIPWGEEASFKGVIDLVNQRAISFEPGESREWKEEAVPEEYKEQMMEYRDKMVEVVAEADDDLLMKYLEGEELTDEEINTGLRQGIIDNKVVPVFGGSANQCMGIETLLEVINTYLPSPEDREAVMGELPGKGEDVERKPSTEEPFSALVFKTLADPYVGRINYFRCYSGVIKSDSQVLNSTKDKTERIGQVFYMRGKTQLTSNEVVAGDIGAVAKLQETSTGDTLCDRNKPVKFASIEFPNPVISFAVEPKNKGDEDKVGTGLARFLDEDPTFKMERKKETKETIISGMGEMQLENIVNKLSHKFGVDVTLSTPKVPYRETIRGRARVEGKHKKQSGGRGQYGHVYLEMEGMEEEGDLQFEDKIFGGVVPKQYVPAVEKGVRETMEEGVLAGYPVVGIKVALVDGSHHSVDSSEMAFKVAGSMAFKKGFMQADPILLEPIMDVEVNVPEEYMGDIMGDINSRRGRIQGMEPADGMQTIKARIPMAEMFRYAIDLRSMTQGRGIFSMQFSHYEEVPSHVSEKIIESAQEEKSKEE